VLQTRLNYVRPILDPLGNFGMSSKYQKLTSYLASLDQSPRTFWFKEIEAILGFALPRSAFCYPAWWSNQTGDGHSQNVAWRSIGWRTANLNLAKQRVTFIRDVDEPDYEVRDLGHVISVFAKLGKSRQASTESTPVITNKELWEAILHAAARDLEDFLKRYSDLRQRQPMLEEVFEKIEEAVRGLQSDRTRIVHRRPGTRLGETPN
jgi:hypothetical protein